MVSLLVSCTQCIFDMLLANATGVYSGVSASGNGNGADANLVGPLYTLCEGVRSQCC